MKLNKKNFINFLNKNFIFEKNPSIAIAVSGGPDSMALLYLMNEWNKRIKGNLVALIINHNLRIESLHEANQVKNFIKKYKIKSKILSVSKKNIIKKNMKEARINRYNLLTNYCNSENILHLFIAHHFDDNIETYVLRRVSGSDFDGLRSIHSYSLKNKVLVVRPLLRYSKKSILDYNKKNNIPFITDPSNKNLNFTRPSIRKFLKESNSIIYNQVLKEFKIINSFTDLYKLMISEILIKNVIFTNKETVVLNLSKFKNIDELISDKVIKKIYHYFYQKKSFLRSAKIQILINQIRESNFKHFNLSNMLVKKVNDSLIFTKKTN